MIRISVVISTYNRQNYLPKALHSLKKQSIDKDLYEIVIVNNNSTDNTDKICTKFVADNKNLNCSYIIEKRQGLSYARNTGIENSRGDLITFMDDDAIAVPDYLKYLLEFFDSHKEINAVGGKILPIYEKGKPKWLNIFLRPLISYHDMGNSIIPYKGKKYPAGANMTFRKSIFNKYGVFKTALGRTGEKLLGCEEKDIFYRLKENHETILYLPQAQVSHFIPGKRTETGFIHELSRESGYSEKLRALSINKLEYVKSLFMELIKWGATIILFFAYSLTLQFNKAFMIVTVRFNITKGLLKSGNND